MDGTGLFDALGSLSLSSDTLEHVFERARIGVYLDDAERGCIYANQDLLTTFGLTWAEFAGFGWANAVHESDREELATSIARFEHERDWIDVRYRVRRPDGSLRHVHALVQALLDGQGVQRGAFGLVRDMTAETEFAARTAEAQKLEAIGRLSGRVAHDFNNLLTSVMISASLLERKTRGKEENESLETIMQAAEHGAALTRQLLTLSGQRRPGHSAIELDPQTRGLHSLLTQVMGESTELVLDLRAGGATIGLAPHELGQILLNLCINGRDALKGAQGVVTVRTRHQAPEVEIVVHDTGAGIALDVQHKMFTPFFTTKAEGRGSGLGLSTVHDLVQRAGGVVSVESEVGRGTRITIRLPCIELTSLARPEATDAPELPVMRILVVDDNDALRQSLAYALALVGHKIQTARTLATASVLLASQSFDMIITDVLLPDGNVADTIARIRAEGSVLPVVYISGFPGEGLGTLDDDPLGAYLPKPFQVPDLLRVMAQLLARIESSADVG